MRIAYEEFGTETLVARLTEWEDPARFHALGVTVVEPSTAMAHLLDHFVRSPSAASLLLGLDESQSVVDVQLRNPDLRGLPCASCGCRWTSSFQRASPRQPASLSRLHTPGAGRLDLGGRLA
ncbi:MAG: hypothetical protein R2838_03225 [Caldilineaceae bacterium]